MKNPQIMKLRVATSCDDGKNFISSSKLFSVEKLLIASTLRHFCLLIFQTRTREKWEILLGTRKKNWKKRESLRISDFLLKKVNSGLIKNRFRWKFGFHFQSTLVAAQTDSINIGWDRVYKQEKSFGNLEKNIRLHWKKWMNEFVSDS